LHCPEYRERYAEYLKNDFPRIGLLRPGSVSESGLLTHQNFKLRSQLIDSLRFLFQLLCLIAAHLRL
jgi:hypothetical protein